MFSARTRGPFLSICIALGAALMVAVGCGGEEPAPKEPVAAAPAAAPKPKRSRQMAVSSELGSLDQGEVDKTFQKLFPDFSQCLTDGSSRVEFIGGHVKFFVRIGSDGRARYAYLPESDLGDRDVEKCMLDRVKGAHWPPPVGGEGQAQNSLDFDPSPSVRPPVGWTADRAAKALAKARPKLERCREGGGGHFRATAYVQTDGTVLAAGVTAPDEKGEQAADCLVDVIRGMKFPSPGSWPAKISFEID